MLSEVLPVFKESSPTQTFAGGNPDGFSMGSIKKKEVFFYESERKAWELLEFMTIMSYKDLGRNDICKCGSRKKFKRCHLDAYNRIQETMQTFGLSQRESMTRHLIWGVPLIEQPIDKWSVYSEPQNT
jgi:hypothetical protein